MTGCDEACVWHTQSLSLWVVSHLVTQNCLLMPSGAFAQSVYVSGNSFSDGNSFCQLSSHQLLVYSISTPCLTFCCGGFSVLKASFRAPLFLASSQTWLLLPPSLSTPLDILRSILTCHFVFRQLSVSLVGHCLLLSICLSFLQRVQESSFLVCLVFASFLCFCQPLLSPSPSAAGS